MFRLLLTCLVLSTALAKPQPNGVFRADGDLHPSPRWLMSAPEPSPRAEPLPLPPPDSEKRTGYELPAGLYFIASPNFPSNYTNNTLFSFTLYGSNAQEISIFCSDFDLEPHRRCRYDYLSVNGVRFCGTTGPDVSADVLDIVFSSDYSVTRGGYYCLIDVPDSDASTTTDATTTDATTADVTATDATTTDATTQTSSEICGIANRASRIVGGVETEANEYGWQAGIVSYGTDRTWCGGTVINCRYVLTAAHCTAEDNSIISPRNIQVLLDEHRIGVSDGEKRFDVENILNHPTYTDAASSGYDFSLLRLSTTINFSSPDNMIVPACLPSGGDFANVDAIVSGWGTTASGGSQANALREVTVQTMTNEQCQQAYSRENINDSMLCAGVDGGGKDSCQGDSGGPLVSEVDGRYYLIGVVSWGYSCADARYPGVYARVTEVSSWIEENADASLC